MNNPDRTASGLPHSPSGYAPRMDDKTGPSRMPRNADTDEPSAETEPRAIYGRLDNALARLRPEHDETPATSPEQDLAEWRANVDPHRPSAQGH
jgi:hypothetical protein